MLVISICTTVLCLALVLFKVRLHNLQSAAQEELRSKLQKTEVQLEVLGRQKQKLKEELSSVYSVAQKLGAATLMKEIVALIVAQLRRLEIPFHSCVISLQERGTLRPVLAETKHADVLALTDLLRLEEPLVRQVLQSRKAKLESNLGQDSQERIFSDDRSAICVPLLVRREIVGVVYLGHAKRDAYTFEHLRDLERLSAVAAPSLKAARLLEEKEQDLVAERESRAEMEARNLQLAGLQQLGQKMGRSLKVLDAQRVVASSLKAMIPEIQSVVFFVPELKGELCSLKADFADSPYADYLRNLVFRLDEGLLRSAVEFGKAVLISHTESDGMESILGSERSVVVAPLMGREESGEQEFLGLLYVGCKLRGGLQEDARDLIETVSYQTAMALKNARLYERTQRLALTDGLTGLSTHRLFQESLGEELERARSVGYSVALVMVDADNFKTYNDTLGHPAGDALLVDIAALLRDKVRIGDLVCRYGGDEFSLLLLGASKSEAQAICESIREAFLLRFGGQRVSVTSSIGFACFPFDADTKEELTKAADEALYCAKRAGRNRVSASKTMAERRTRPLVHEVLLRC